MYRILILFARYELCTDLKFINFLENLDAQRVSEEDGAECEKLELYFE